MEGCSMRLGGGDSFLLRGSDSTDPSRELGSSVCACDVARRTGACLASADFFDVEPHEFPRLSNSMSF
jgi:hypothetical protein